MSTLILILQFKVYSHIGIHQRPMQAFHWFANEDSLREIHRVLKPTGGFIMFANREDDRDPWAKAILCSFEPYSKVSNASNISNAFILLSLSYALVIPLQNPQSAPHPP